jgi:prevent-host-death family protein
MSTKIMPISDLRREASRVLEILKEKGDAVYITHYGRPVAVMVDYERYEQLLQQLDELTEQRSQGATEPALNHTARLAGLHREVWDGIDSDAYLQKERKAWEN